MTWTLIVLFQTGFMLEVKGHESLQDCEETNKFMRQLIWQPKILNPQYACVPEKP